MLETGSDPEKPRLHLPSRARSGHEQKGLRIGRKAHFPNQHHVTPKPKTMPLPLAPALLGLLLLLLAPPAQTQGTNTTNAGWNLGRVTYYGR